MALCIKPQHAQAEEQSPIAVRALFFHHQEAFGAAVVYLFPHQLQDSFLRPPATLLVFPFQAFQQPERVPVYPVGKKFVPESMECPGLATGAFFRQHPAQSPIPGDNVPNPFLTTNHRPQTLLRAGVTPHPVGLPPQGALDNGTEHFHLVLRLGQVFRCRLRCQFSKRHFQKPERQCLLRCQFF